MSCHCDTISNFEFKSRNFRSYLRNCPTSLMRWNLRKLSSWKISCCCNGICMAIGCCADFDDYISSFCNRNGDLVYFIGFVKLCLDGLRMRVRLRFELLSLFLQAAFQRGRWRCGEILDFCDRQLRGGSRGNDSQGHREGIRSHLVSTAFSTSRGYQYLIPVSHLRGQSASSLLIPDFVRFHLTALSCKSWLSL
jgi:hypothetical protein